MVLSRFIVLIGAAIILLERSRHTFPAGELLQILSPNRKTIAEYLTDTSAVIIYSGVILFSSFWFFTHSTDFTAILNNHSRIVISCILFCIGFFARKWSVKSLGSAWSVLLQPKGRLVTIKGPYKYIRHPYYLSSLIEFFAITLFFWGFGGALALTFLQGLAYEARALTEDRFLSKKFGNNFSRYAKIVPAFFPLNPFKAQHTAIERNSPCRIS